MNYTFQKKQFSKIQIDLKLICFCVSIGMILFATCSKQNVTNSNNRFQKVVKQFSFGSMEIPVEVMSEAKYIEKQINDQPPVENLRIFNVEKSGALWLGGVYGAARFDPNAENLWDRWQYFYGQRWLQDNVVLNIHVEEKEIERNVWIRTKTGVSKISWMKMTLEEKAEHYDQKIEARHVRFGFVAKSHLKEPGNVLSNVNIDNDNDGLWTAMYMAAQVYRFAVTGSDDARKKAKRSLRALIRLEKITGIPGFFARSFKSKDEPAPIGGEWHETPDGDWIWKGDTSSDEEVGHYFGYAIYYDLIADENEKRQIREVVGRLTDHLIENNWNLIDVDGKPTRWGRWGMEYFKTEEGAYEKALRSSQLLSFLKIAYHITGNNKYEAAYKERIDQGYATNMLYYRKWKSAYQEINFSDDELYYLSVFPLLLLEKDSTLQENYRTGVRYTWNQIKPDMNPLWNFMSVATGAIEMTDQIQKESLLTLNRIPLDMINWSCRNSHRFDIELKDELERHGRFEATRVLPPDERPVHKWNENPYVVDGGGHGSSEEAPTYYLLPYWMGKYYGWIE
jgi:hypothetical protein